MPPVRDVDFLYDAAGTLPLVPGSVEDCCTRMRDRTDPPSRDAARELLTLIEALGLAVETERGYHRVREPPDARRSETPSRETSSASKNSWPPSPVPTSR